MEAACKGAAEANGLTIGILPGNDIGEANAYVKIPIATGLGIARNIFQLSISIQVDPVMGKLQLRKDLGASLHKNRVF